MNGNTVLREIKTKSFVPKPRVLNKINSYVVDMIVLSITFDRDVCLWCEVTDKANQTNKFLLEKVYQARYPNMSTSQLCDVAINLANSYQQWLSVDLYSAPVIIDNYPERKEFEIF